MARIPVRSTIPVRHARRRVDRAWRQGDITTMDRRPLRRAATLSIAALVAFAGTASADSLLADGDVLSTTVQGSVYRGVVPAGAEVVVPVRFVLNCASLRHADVGQTIELSWSGGGTVPTGGSVESVTSTTVGPIPAEWGVDGEGCGDPVPSIASTTHSVVTLRAPTTPATGYSFVIEWDRALQPPGHEDDIALGFSLPSVEIRLDVVGNAAPTLTFPVDRTREGDTTGGWTADWSGVTAADPEDSPDPVPTCTPADGSVLALGPTTVACSVTDSAGRTTTGSFVTTVVDTTAPVLTMPADRTVTTTDPSGATLDFDLPAAADVVDPTPTVLCSPAAGTSIPLGPTTVTCSATDASRNVASGSFVVTVEHVATHTASAVWLEPVGVGGSIVANRGRSLPVKVQLFVDGLERSSGDADLDVTPCGGGAPRTFDLMFGGGRWNLTLETAPLAGSCYAVAASIDGLEAGSFRLDMRGSAASAKQLATPLVRVRTSRR
jgi:hypothetical protein